jgi:hypothetical protein
MNGICYEIFDKHTKTVNSYLNNIFIIILYRPLKYPSLRERREHKG